MPKYSGRKISVGFGKETTRGTAVSPSTWFPRTDMDFEDKIESVTNEVSIGVLVDSVDTAVVRIFSEGSISSNFGVNAMSLPLLASFGSVTTTTATTGAYKHTFSLANLNERQSLTVSMHDPVNPYKFALGTIKKLTFKYEQDKFIDVSMEIMAQKGVADGALTPTFVTDHYLLGRHANIKIASNTAGLNAALNRSVKNFEITLEFNVEEEYNLGNITPTDFLTGSIGISGSIESVFQNESDYKTDTFAGSSRALRITAVNPDVTIGLSSNPSFMLELPKITYEEISRKMSNDEIVTQTCKFKGHYSTEEAKAIVAELINTVSSI